MNYFCIDKLCKNKSSGNKHSIINVNTNISKDFTNLSFFSPHYITNIVPIKHYLILSTWLQATSKTGSSLKGREFERKISTDGKLET